MRQDKSSDQQAQSKESQNDDDGEIGAAQTSVTSRIRGKKTVRRVIEMPSVHGSSPLRLGERCQLLRTLYKYIVLRYIMQSMRLLGEKSKEKGKRAPQRSCRLRRQIMRAINRNMAEAKMMHFIWPVLAVLLFAGVILWGYLHQESRLAIRCRIASQP